MALQQRDGDRDREVKRCGRASSIEGPTFEHPPGLLLALLHCGEVSEALIVDPLELYPPDFSSCYGLFHPL
jgi:hypothetical protein